MGCKSSKSAGFKPQDEKAQSAYYEIAEGKAPPAQPVDRDIVPGMLYNDLRDGERAQLGLLTKMTARRSDADSSLVSSAYKDLVSGKIGTDAFIDRLQVACPMFIEVAAAFEAKVDDKRAELGMTETPETPNTKDK